VKGRDLFTEVAGLFIAFVCYVGWHERSQSRSLQWIKAY
jgi:hypothetical protein